MNIGFYFSASKHSGGVYQYTQSLLDSLLEVSNLHFTIFNTSPSLPSKYRSNKEIKIIDFQSNNPTKKTSPSLINSFFNTTFMILIKIGFHTRQFWLIKRLLTFPKKHQILTINKENLDLIIYPISSNLSFLTNSPPVVAVHDLAHRLYPSFPEVSKKGTWELREYTYQQITRVSKKILVDSRIGKEDIVNNYSHIDSKKIVILPFLPPSYLNNNQKVKTRKKILSSFNIDKNYFYYPANFWPHKHHLNLIESLNICHQQGHLFSLVFTGNKHVEYSTYSKVIDKAKEYGLSSYVHFLGYVDGQTLTALYKGSIALIMPTNFGPTNIPVLEAWKLETPVIYSNVRGCKQQLGDAGILADPSQPTDWAKAMIKIKKSPQLKKSLIKKGNIRLNLWTKQKFNLQVKRMMKDIISSSDTIVS